MNSLLIGLLTALAATNQPAAVSNLVVKTTGISVAVADPNDPVEREYQKLLADDDAAQEEADKWIRDAQAFEEKGAGLPKATLALKVEQRLEPVRKAYEDFLQRHPKHVAARLAYGSFLNDIRREEEAVAQWEKARQLDPQNPASWNNLANFYGHSGPVKKAFEYYTKAIELDPKEPVYLQNFATTIYLFRKDAMELYQINEQQVFDRALELYRKAIKLDPKNLLLATDLAQTFYGIRPPRTEEALGAWNDALNLATNAVEKEGIYLHLARVELNSGKFDEARKHLNIVTNDTLSVLKNRLLRNLLEKESRARNTNAPAKKD